MRAARAQVAHARGARPRIAPETSHLVAGTRRARRSLVLDTHARFAVLVGLFLLCASACASASEDGPPEGEDTGPTEEALSSGAWVVNGHYLGSTHAQWVDFVAKQVVPHLPGTTEERVTLAARGVWWTLKEGNLERVNWGRASSPVGYSLCNTTSGDRHIGPLEACGREAVARDQTLFGRAWQVGLAGVQVPGRRIDRVEALASELYGGAAIDELLAQTAALAGYPRGSATSRAIVSSEGAVRLSWLLRIPAVGFVEVVTKEVVPECVEGSKGWCFGTSWDETRKFAPTKADALRAIADLERILSKAAGGVASASCWSPSLGADVEEKACVQSRQSGTWFQCVGGDWRSGVSGAEGPSGPCRSVHPR